MAMKRKSVDQIKTPGKMKKTEKESNGVPAKEDATPKKFNKKHSISSKNADSDSVGAGATPKKFNKKHSISNKNADSDSVGAGATPKKLNKKHSISNKNADSDSVGAGATPKKSIMKHSISENDTNGISVRAEATSKKASRKHLIVEKKSDKDLFSLNDLPGDADVVENIDEEDFLSSSSEDESEEKKKKKDSDEEDDEEEDDEKSDDEVDSDESVDEKLIADDSSDEEEDKTQGKKKKDFGLSSVLISSSSYIKKNKLVKYLSKLDVNIKRCWHLYSTTYLVTCETAAQAQVLLASDAGIQVKGALLKVAKLPFFVVLENLPNYIKVDDIKKAVASCIEKTGIGKVTLLHINKCFVEFITEQAFEKFTKKVSKLNVSGKTVRIVPWLDKIIQEHSLRNIKIAHLPPNANVELIVRKLLEHDVKSKEIYQVKFYSRNTCTLYCQSDETVKKLLALNSKIQFEKGALFMTLCTSKVVLKGVPESATEETISEVLESQGIDESNIHSIKIQNDKATVELKTKEEEEKVLELDSSLEIDGCTIKILPLTLLRQKAVTLGLLKLPASTTKTQVLEALAVEGQHFDEKDVEFEHGEKNSVVLFLNGSEDLQKKLASIRSLIIGRSSIKVSFCKFGTGKDSNCSRKSTPKRVQKKKKKNKKRQIKKQKKKAAEESD